MMAFRERRIFVNVVASIATPATSNIAVPKAGAASAFSIDLIAVVTPEYAVNEHWVTALITFNGIAEVSANCAVCESQDTVTAATDTTS